MIDWEKVYANHISGKGLAKLNIKYNSIRKQTKEMKRHYIEEDIRVLNKHMQRYSTSLALKEMQSKMRYHYIPTRIDTIQNSAIPRAGEDMEKMDFSYWWECKMVHPF